MTRRSEPKQFQGPATVTVAIPGFPVLSYKVGQKKAFLLAYDLGKKKRGKRK